MAEKDSTLFDKLSNTEAVEDEADSFSNCSRRDSNDLVTGDERRQSEESVSKDISNVDSRTDSISDQILGEMGSHLEGSPNNDEDEVIHKQEDDHEDILDVQAGVDATIDDQFEVLDSAGETDHLEHLEEVGRSTTTEDEKRRSKTKHTSDHEERSHDKTREPHEKEPDNKGFVL